MPYSDEDLEALLADLESDLVERKRSAADADKIRRTICAFANDLPGHARAGVIFVGVDDDGTCARASITDDMLSKLGQARSDGSIQPLPSIVVQKRTLNDCTLAVVIVEPSHDPPVRYSGRVFVRVGPTVQQASPSDERILAERRRSGDRPFDRRACQEACLEDLDLDYVRAQYLPRAIAAEVLEQNSRPIEQQLHSLRLLSQGRPTWGALLSFGRDPQHWVPGAWVQFVRVDGAGVSDPIRDQKELTGRLEDILRHLDDLIDLNISVRASFVGEKREASTPDYPASALRQLVRNAIMHRAYDGAVAPVRVRWFSDRVEILSPGGLPPGVTPESFGHGPTAYRNPLIAEVMHHLGFAQRFGFGVPVARSELQRNGNPAPEFHFEPTLVAVIVRPAP